MRRKPVGSRARNEATPATTVVRIETPSVQTVAAIEKASPAPAVMCAMATAPAPTRPGVPWTTRAQQVVLVVMVGVMLVVARRSFQPAPFAIASPEATMGDAVANAAHPPPFEAPETVQPAAIARVEPPDGNLTVTVRPAKKAPATTKPLAAEQPKETESVEPTPPAAATVVAPSGQETAAHAVESSVKPEIEQRAAVTISGCVEGNVEESAFRLTNTDGADAPRSRSWKSGFLRKRAASVALIDAGHLQLRAYVGQRIAATGLLTNREMQVRSLRPAGSSCGD